MPQSYLTVILTAVFAYAYALLRNRVTRICFESIR